MAKPVSLSFSSDGKTLYALDAATARGDRRHPRQPRFSDSGASRNHQPDRHSVARGFTKSASALRGRRQRSGAASSRRCKPADRDGCAALVFSPPAWTPFGSSSFVLASRSQSANPLWLFASTPQPGAYFVPAIQLRPPDHRSHCNRREDALVHSVLRAFVTSLILAALGASAALAQSTFDFRLFVTVNGNSGTVSNSSTVQSSVTVGSNTTRHGPGNLPRLDRGDNFQAPHNCWNNIPWRQRSRERNISAGAHSRSGLHICP